MSHPLEGYVIQNRSEGIAGWFLSFEEMRRSQRELPEEDADPEFVALWGAKTQSEGEI